MQKHKFQLILFIVVLSLSLLAFVERILYTPKSCCLFFDVYRPNSWWRNNWNTLVATVFDHGARGVLELAGDI
jgi:hypothetical protein